jgi:hypothetical protein
MTHLTTAILHLRSPLGIDGDESMLAGLRALRGVVEIDLEPKDALVAVRFDRSQTGLADIVRSVEDAGRPVAGVAERG